MVETAQSYVTACVSISFVVCSYPTIQRLFILKTFTRKVKVQCSPLLS